MKRLSMTFAILIFVSMAFGQANYNTYGNARFGYSISYPSNLLTPQGEADNGDGQKFTGDGATMLIFGSNLLLHETLLKEYNAVIAERGTKNVTYKIIGKNFFAISGQANGKIFYQKTIKEAQGAYITFMIEYNESKRTVYDEAVRKMVKSFK